MRAAVPTQRSIVIGGLVLLAVAALLAGRLARDLPGSVPGSDAPDAAEACPDAVRWERIWHDPEGFEGKTRAVRGRVAEATYASSTEGRPTFLNVGNPHPATPRFDVLIWGRHRSAFLEALPAPPERHFPGRRICAVGTVRQHEGVPQIELTSPRSLRSERPRGEPDRP